VSFLGAGLYPGGEGVDLDWRIAIAIAILAGVFGGTTVPHLSPNVVRPDPFTATMAKEMERRIKDMDMDMERRLTERWKHEMELFRIVHSQKCPPEPTRQRIESLEDAMSKVYDKIGFQPYRRPTSRFNLGAFDRSVFTGSGGGGGE
jgi:hypothetical protein